jgi:hypothetical protein
VGPLRSAALYYVHLFSGGRIRQDLRTYFGHSEVSVNQPTLELQQASKVLGGIDRSLSGVDNVPGNFIGDKYGEWRRNWC